MSRRREARPIRHLPTTSRQPSGRTPGSWRSAFSVDHQRLQCSLRALYASVGRLADRIGYKRTFLLGTVIILVASIGSALAPNILLLDVGRMLAGAGGAAVFTALP